MLVDKGITRLHGKSVNENVRKLEEVQYETRNGDEGSVLIIESRLVDGRRHPIGQHILESDHELVDEFLERLVLVIAVARGENVVDDDAARSGDRRIDAVHFLLAFLDDAGFHKLSVLVYVQATTNLDIFGVDGLTAVSLAISFVDQVLASDG